MSRPINDAKRLLWIVNHKTLLPAEVPILRELGYEVFIPKRIPSDPEYRSAVVTYDYDATLSVPPSALAILNNHHFYGNDYKGHEWSPTLINVINTYFDVLITSVSAYLSPLREAVRHFDGPVLGRVFGREHPATYSALIEYLEGKELIEAIGSCGKRFILAQGFDNLAEIEPPELGGNAQTVTVPLPSHIYDYRNIWKGTGSSAVFICPGIRLAGGYYKDIYDGIKRDFSDLPHTIFGRQHEAIPDPNVLAYLSEADLISLYQDAPVFIYPSTEPRHIHYSPLEAMVVGTPVLYRRDSLSDALCERRNHAGACSDTVEMRAKAKRLLAGDKPLANAIRRDQQTILEKFSLDLARRQWANILRFEGQG